MTRFHRFLAELKRRGVYRAALLYAVVGLAVLEGADVLVPALGLPASIVTGVAVLALVCFPVALVVAWFYQVTPHGLEPTPEAPSPASPGVLLPLGAAGVAVAFVAFASGWLLRPAVDGGAEPESERTPIAVLPFTNMSGPEDEYFTDGLHEEVIARLSGLSSFRVTSRTSVMGYRDEPKPIPEVGRELGVDAILEGSVRRAGSTLRMTAQLVDARHDEHLWTATYDREYSMEAILAIQEDVAGQVAQALRVALADDESEVATPTGDLQAYDLYLLGRHHWNARTPDGLRRAIELFEQATELDPGFARAWAGLSEAYAVLSPYDPGTSPRQAMASAREAASRALSLNPDLAEAHASLGFIAFSFDWDPETAERHFDRAVELNPSHAPGLYWRAWYHGFMGRFDEARIGLERALAVGPRSVAVRFNTGATSMLMGDHTAARARLRGALELDPSFPTAWLDLGSTELLAGDHEAAREAWRSLGEVMGWPPPLSDALAAIPENPSAARVALRASIPMDRMSLQDRFAALLLFAAASDTGTVVPLLAEAHEARLPGVLRAYQLPYVAPFLDHPELEAVTRDLRDAFGAR